MKHIVVRTQQNIYDSALWRTYFDGLKVGVLDIETTGLNPSRNKFILGCLYDVDSGEIHQILAESRAEETIALKEYMSLVSEMDMVITYNGRSFDMPFLERRWKASESAINYLNREEQTRVAMRMPYNLDLYAILKTYSPIRKLVPNMHQKTIENYMGFWDTRTDEISGRESVELYNHYEQTGDADAERRILLHNSDDVRQLTKLTKAITKSDFHRAMYNLGFPVKAGGSLLQIQSISFTGNEIKISGSQSGDTLNYMGFEYNGVPVVSSFITVRVPGMSADAVNSAKPVSGDRAEEIHRRTGSFEISIPVVTCDGLSAVDMLALDMDDIGFARYPGAGSGFLTVKDRCGVKYREINHLIQTFLKKFVEEVR